MVGRAEVQRVSLPVPFRRQVWDELVARELIPPGHVYQDVRERVSGEGARLWADMDSLATSPAWRDAMATLPTPLKPDDPIRVLGFGWLLTRFLIAPLGLPPDTEQRVADVGALANLIVTTYDAFLDAGIPALSLLPEDVFERIRRTTRPPRWRGRGAPAPGQAVSRLVGRYYTQVESLPHGGAADTARRLLDTSVVRMHAAEVALQEPGAVAVPGLLRRKAALPFVVMGMPAWLPSDSPDRGRCAWHLRWMFGVGAFIGQIDDTIDLEADQQANEPNLVEIALRSRMPAAVAAGIATRGAQSLDEWRRRLPSEPPGWLRFALPSVVYSWFGASDVQP